MLKGVAFRWLTYSMISWQIRRGSRMRLSVMYEVSNSRDVRSKTFSTVLVCLLLGAPVLGYRRSFVDMATTARHWSP